MKHTRYESFDASTSIEEAARRNHYESETVTESFWRSAAASLPPHVRRRYAHFFEAAERWEPVLDFLVDACSSAWRALAGLFHGWKSRRGSKRQRNFGAIGKA